MTPSLKHTSALCLLLLVAFLVYWPGLSGPFLFDDFHNLSLIGALGPIENWGLAKAYLSSGFAGPTGRPIALASFLVDARDWPADPESFKRTNLMVHLLIGALLFATIKVLLQSIGRNAQTAAGVALLATALWLLNPFLVSTTLYVVQRMTQLAALFVLLGVWGYLQGRLYLPTRPRLGYTLITLSVVLGTVLAVYSKENGVLLPLLILVIEVALRFHWITPAPDWRWRAVFLWVPTVVIVVYLIQRIPSDGIYANRDFTLAERLWTQPRFIFDYLWHLFIPHIQTQGLYQDGRVVSTSWTTPWTTLTAIIGLMGLIVMALWARYRWPLVSLAILFFLAGHLLESTTLGLELYFEHRNYLPAVFLFVPVAAGILALRGKVSRPVIALMLVAAIGSYSVATYQRASLWSDEDQLMLVWAETNPQSPRAQSGAAEAVARMVGPEMAAAYFFAAMQQFPDSTLLTLNYLSVQTALGRLDSEEFAEAIERLRLQPFNAEMRSGLRHLVERLNVQPMTTVEHVSLMMTLLEHIRADRPGGEARHLIFYLQGRLLAGQGYGHEAYEHFSQAVAQYRRISPTLEMVSVLAQYGHYDSALALLEQASEVLANQPDNTLSRNRSTYAAEIERLRLLILEDQARSSE